MALSSSLMSFRFSGDTTQLEFLRADENISKHLSRSRGAQEKSLRARLLACAVRVDRRLIPRIATAFQAVQDRVELTEALEAYVYDEASIRASVIKGHSHIMVLLSSGAVHMLNDNELEFVIGHELGHAIFGHLDVEASYLVESEAVDPRSCLKLLAWQRAAEISADRCGLVCCGSLDVASTALFKTLSGLNMEGLVVPPSVFAEQWDHLASEFERGVGVDDWQLTHPFPPLRVKAMMAFWDVACAEGRDPSVLSDRVRQEIDDEISKLLVMLDPLARESSENADPILADYFLWGGLYLALANDELHNAELSRLSSLTSAERVADATRSGSPSSSECLEQFRACIEKRHRRLKAMEIHRILQGLLQIAISDGEIDDAETQAIEDLATELGIRASACELLISKFLQKR